jgi:hypothetical protein
MWDNSEKSQVELATTWRVSSIMLKWNNSCFTKDKENWSTIFNRNCATHFQMYHRISCTRIYKLGHGGFNATK